MATRVLKEGDLFLLTDAAGDIAGPERPPGGLFWRDTQFLSDYALTVEGEELLLLADSGRQTHLSTIRLAARTRPEGWQELEQGELALERRRLIHAGVFYERIRLENFGSTARSLRLRLRFASRFADIFEVRGLERPQRGADLPPAVTAEAVVLGYRGRDDHTRQCRLAFAPAPARVEGGEAAWELNLPPGGSAVLQITVTPSLDGRGGEAVPFAAAEAALAAAYAEWWQTTTRVEAGNAGVQAVLDRSLADLRLLVTDLGLGPYLAAGIPWYATPFGRDALIAALQMLMFRPDVALGTLRTLAALQGQREDPRRAEQPGKIVHEVRYGEMANLDEVPFGRYYGSVDSTPLFLLLYAEYLHWTGDLAAGRELLPAVRRALAWADRYRFLEFDAVDGGLAVQSWKDSADSMTHADGTPARPPLAVSEAQGYLYAACHALATLLPRLGEPALGRRLAARATELQRDFAAAFWLPDLGFYAMALDRDQRPLAVLNSDAGHCLYTGIALPEHAGAVAERLLGPELFSGWGLRTLGREAAAYNPMSYHNGSVWPHDTALAALGLRRYGQVKGAQRLAEGIFAAAGCFPEARLPELFCGYDRSEGEPVAYPVACSPQAWAAGAPLMLIQALLGAEVDALAGELRLAPRLPAWLPHLAVSGLRVGDSTVAFTARREGEATRVENLEVTGGLKVVLA